MRDTGSHEPLVYFLYIFAEIIRTTINSVNINLFLIFFRTLKIKVDRTKLIERCSVRRSTFDKLTTDLEKIATKILGEIIKEN